MVTVLVPGLPALFGTTILGWLAVAEDLVQAFFEKFPGKNYLEGLGVERGKFRAFLLASQKHFLANEWDKSQRQKCGGGVPHLSLDWQGADERYHLDPPDPASPDKTFGREWLPAMLERVITRLHEECAANRKSRTLRAGEMIPHGRRGGDFLRPGSREVEAG